MAESEKRAHVSTGQTPHKEKQAKQDVGRNGAPKKRLSFSSSKIHSPSTKVARYLVTRAKRTAMSPSSAKLMSSPPKQKAKRLVWRPEEDVALVQFVALYKDTQPTDKEWPAMKAYHPYWTNAAQFIQTTAKTPYRREPSSIRQRVVVEIRRKYETLEKAEDALGLAVEYYIENEPSPVGSGKNTQTSTPTKTSHLSLTKVEQIGLATACCSAMNASEKVDFLDKMMATLPGDSSLELLKKLSLKMMEKHMIEGPLKLVNNFLDNLVTKLEDKKVDTFLQGLTNKLFLELAKQKGVSTNPADYATLSLKGMECLEKSGKANLLYKFSQCFGSNKSSSNMPPMPLDRMPFGLISYMIQFFTCTDVRQIRISEDYRLWLQTMDMEFPSRFHRLLAGPMWSGIEQKHIGNPEKARTNIPAPSLVSNWRHNKESLQFTTTPGFQPSALDELKKANPEGRYWIKLDGTDIKEGLMESMRGKWNGDVDLLDGKVNELRKEYDSRLEVLKQTASKNVTFTFISSVVKELKTDVEFLTSGLQKARSKYKEKYEKRNTPEAVLKSLNWEMVEYNILLTQSQQLQYKYESINIQDKERDRQTVNLVLLKQLESDSKLYLKNLYKKKRDAADHVVVWMLSDEKRDTKPYALPVGYVPCKTLRDQHVRDLNAPLKQEMKKRGLKLSGVTTDGEYCSLRSQGETRALNLWQLVHDAKESVRKMKKQTILDMLVVLSVDGNGKPVVQQPCEFIPDDLVVEIHNLRNVSGMTLEDAISNVRGKLVPAGHTPYPFRSNSSENFPDKLRSIAATCQFRHSVQYWKERGVDFSLYLYIPEVDPITEEVRHDRSDHNHVLKRIGKSTREGHNTGLNFDAFDAALKDPKSGLTHAALVGLRKQSVQDVERLLSVHVVKSMRDQGYHNEANYVEIISNWHEASDGRGLTQLQRCRYNYRMLNYILDQLMPWHKEMYDFTTIDVNRPWEYVQGFSRESVIEITTNIESQEYRRRENYIVGYPEHPRAGGTDDLENFFSIIHRLLGAIFTLKQFREIWNQVVREFTKKMDVDLPFYYHTLNDRFTDDVLPSFDKRPEFDADQVELRTHPLRLHQLRLNQREDGAIFTAGRNFLPVKNKTTIRSRVHRPEAELPPVPDALI